MTARKKAVIKSKINHANNIFLCINCFLNTLNITVIDEHNRQQVTCINMYTLRDKIMQINNNNIPKVRKNNVHNCFLKEIIFNLNFSTTLTFNEPCFFGVLVPVPKRLTDSKVIRVLIHHTVLITLAQDVKDFTVYSSEIVHNYCTKSSHS